nr:hypothetical protein [uncultured Prevotella sp.]
MTYHKEKKQRNQLLAARRKPYIAPWSNNIPIDTTHILAGSGPNAGIEDNKYGGRVFDEITEDN